MNDLTKLEAARHERFKELETFLEAARYSLCNPDAAATLLRELSARSQRLADQLKGGTA
jgi:septal ring factor EnvC (AmiA/AmiB activator)